MPTTETKREAFLKYLRHGNGADSPLSAAERRDLGYGTDGAVLPPKDFAKRIAVKLQQYALWSLVTQVPRSVMSSSFPYPTTGLSSSTGFRARTGAGGTDFLTPAGTSPNLALPNFGTLAAEDRRAHNASIVSCSIFVSNELFEDTERSGASVEEYLAEEFARNITGVCASKFVVGTGTNEPKGIKETCRYGVTGSLDNGVVAAAGATIAYGDLGKLVRGVGGAYYPRCAWMLCPEALADIPSRAGLQITAGVTDSGVACPMLLGRPVIVCDDLDAPAAGSKYSVALADLSRYVVTKAGPDDFYFVRAKESALSGGANVSLVIGYMRIDGVLVDPNAARILRHT